MAEIRVQDEQGNLHIFPDGSTPEMIAKTMKVKAPSTSGTPVAEKPGFFRRLGQSLGVPTSREEFASVAADAASHPDEMLGAGGVVKKMLRGYGEQVGHNWQDYKQDLTGIASDVNAGRNTPITGIQRMGTSAALQAVKDVPLVGPALFNYGSDIREGNYKGAAGSALGITAQVAGPKILPRLLPRGASVLPDVWEGEMPAEIPSGKTLGKPSLIHRIASTASNAGNPDVVGLASPRLAHLQRLAGKVADITSPRLSAERPIQSATARDVRGPYQSYDGDLTVNPSPEAVPSSAEFSPAPYRMRGQQITDARTATPRRIIGTERQLPAHVDATSDPVAMPRPAPLEGKSPAAAQTAMLKKMGVASPAATVRPMTRVPAAELRPRADLSFKGSMSGEDAAMNQLTENYSPERLGINDLRGIAMQRGIKVSSGDSHAELIGKIHDSMTPEEVDAFDQARIERMEPDYRLPSVENAPPRPSALSEQPSVPAGDVEPRVPRSDEEMEQLLMQSVRNARGRRSGGVR